jgi:hypothetical protein
MQSVRLFKGKQTNINMDIRIYGGPKSIIPYAGVLRICKSVNISRLLSQDENISHTIDMKILLNF